MPTFIPSGWEDLDEDKTQYLNFEQDSEEDVDVDETQYMSFRRPPATRPPQAPPVAKPPLPESGGDSDDGETQFFRRSTQVEETADEDEDEDADATRFMSSRPGVPTPGKPGGK